MKIKKYVISDKEQNTQGLPIPATGLVPMVKPAVPHPDGLRVLFIGNIPYESYTKLPFSGPTYGKLKNLCENAKFDLRHAYVTNILDYYPEGKAFSSEAGLARLRTLREEIEAINPSVIIPLGSDAFISLFGDLNLPRDKQETSLEDARGFPCYLSINGKEFLTVPTYHPTDLFMRHNMTAVAGSDIAKAIRLAKDGWKTPSYKINYWPTFDEVCTLLDDFYSRKTYLSADLETRGTFITCCGLAWSKTEGLVIPFHRESLKPYWPPDQELIIWRKLARVLEHCPLLGQNAVHFDTKIGMHYKIRFNFVDDTMFAGWQCYQELPKDLGFMLSLYTDLPYHKDMLSAARSGKIDYKMEFYYCGLDCCTTYELLVDGLIPEMKTRPRGSYHHYKFNIQMSRTFEYASAHGLCFDTKKRDERLVELKDTASTMEKQINMALGRAFNVRSPQQVKSLFYDEWKLPPAIKTVFDKDTGEREDRETADYLTTLYLARQYPNLPLLDTIGKLRKLNKRISSLEGIIPDDKGMVYWDFSTVGTKFGRASGKKPMNHHGCQPQNVDRRDRDLFVAPPGWLLLKADLEGADSWTQAAQLACVGDSRLMDDLLKKLKPAQALAIASIHGDQMMGLPAEEFLKFKKELKTEDGEVIYGIMKAVSHGSAYMMKKMTMHKNIFKKSDGDLYVNPNECEKKQGLFYKRYNFPKVHEFMRNVMVNQGYLDFSDGSRHYFLGRKDDATLREMLASAPQNHTSRAANTTILRIFHAPENRDSSNHLIMRPINQVHDETDMLFPETELNFVSDTFKKYCSVEQVFWGQKFVIPFEANYGKDWGSCKADLFSV